jgi:hypothetical protein
LFGPAVVLALDVLRKEMDTTRSGGKSGLMDTLIAYWWKDMFKTFDRDPGEIQWLRTVGPSDKAVGRAE